MQILIIISIILSIILIFMSHNNIEKFDIPYYDTKYTYRSKEYQDFDQDSQYKLIRFNNFYPLFNSMDNVEYDNYTMRYRSSELDIFNNMLGVFKNKINYKKSKIDTTSLFVEVPLYDANINNTMIKKPINLIESNEIYEPLVMDIMNMISKKNSDFKIECIETKIEKNYLNELSIVRSVNKCKLFYHNKYLYKINIFMEYATNGDYFYINDLRTLNIFNDSFLPGYNNRSIF